MTDTNHKIAERLRMWLSASADETGTAPVPRHADGSTFDDCIRAAADALSVPPVPPEVARLVIAIADEESLDNRNERNDHRAIFATEDVTYGQLRIADAWAREQATGGGV